MTFTFWLEEAVGTAGLAIAVFEIYATVLRARKRPGPVSERMNRGLWLIAGSLSRPLTRQKRHAVLEALGPLLLPFLALVLVGLLLLSFALLYRPHFPLEFHSATSGPKGLHEVLYFSGVTLLTIGYGDVAPNSSTVQTLALVEGITGLAFLSLFTAYLLTVSGAVQQKRSVALSWHIQANKGADVPGLITHYFRKGRFLGLDEALRKGWIDAQNTMELHIEHPVIAFYHSSAVYKSFPRMLFILLETAALMQSLPSRSEYADAVDSPELNTLAESTPSIVQELVIVLNLQTRLASGDGPIELLPRLQRCFRRAEATFQKAGILTETDKQAAFNRYREHRRGWERALFVVSEFLGYDWEEISGDGDLWTAREDESQEVQHLL